VGYFAVERGGRWIRGRWIRGRWIREMDKVGE